MSDSARPSRLHLLELYDSLISTIAGLERKGATMPYTSVNGHMSSFLTPDDRLALRLSPDDRASFLNEFEDAICTQHGTVMKEYVLVPDSLLQNELDRNMHFAASYKYVASLKPKPVKTKQQS